MKKLPLHKTKTIRKKTTVIQPCRDTQEKWSISLLRE